MTPNQKWRAKNPAKVKAHFIVQNAKRTGHLIPQPCEQCGDLKSAAHHADYAKPLEITWLCSRCHRQLHAAQQGQELHPPGFIHSGRKIPRKPIVWPYRTKFRPAPIRDALLAKAQQLRSAGNSYGNIAKDLDISIGTVYKWLNPKQYK